MKKIAIFVTSTHFLLIFSLLFSPMKKNIHPTKHIAVRTIQHRPKIQTGTSVAVQGIASPIRTSPPKASSSKSATANPKTLTKASSKSTAAAAPSSSSSTSTSNKKLTNSTKPVAIEKNKKGRTNSKAAPPPEFFKEIDETLAKIDEKGYSKPRLNLDVPHIQDSSVNTLPFPVESGVISEPMGPEETLNSYLRSSLNLPEFGEVKIQVTVNKEGCIEKLVVLHAESKKNKAYLEQHLPLLKLPIAVEKDDKEKTFILRFCNNLVN